MEADNTITKIIPAPTGGWNARDPIHMMADNDAIELINYFPDVDTVVHRPGCVKFGDTTGMVFNLFGMPGEGGDAKLFSMEWTGPSTYKMYRYDVATAVGTDITNGVVLDYWEYQHTIFQNKLFAVSGYAAPFSCSASANCTATAWTGPADINMLVQVDSYRGRLYFAERNSTKVWYGGLLAITGALTYYDTASFLSKGGAVMAVGSTTKQSGDLNTNMFVIVSTEGEVLIYTGDFPGSATWNLAGRFFIAPPLGRRCLVYKGADLHIITAQGIVPVGSLLSNDKVLDKEGRETSQYRAISDKIQNAFVDAANNWKAADLSESWAAHYAPYHKMFLLVVPQESGGVASNRLWVQNAITGAWCVFENNSQPLQWVAVDDQLYYAASTSIWAQQKIGSDVTQDAQSQYVQASCRQAFNYLGDINKNKHVVTAKAFFTLTQSAGHGVVVREVEIGADSDFQDEDITNQISLQPIATDGTINYAVITDQIRAEGLAFSLLLKTRFDTGYKFKWNLILINYEPGGLLS